MTLHMHRVDDDSWVEDGQHPLDVPAGWQIAEGSADDARVCGSHPWQSEYLVFANGDACETAERRFFPRTGDCLASASVEKAHKNTNYENVSLLKLKSGRNDRGGSYLVEEENGLRARYSDEDVLLRKRV
jgi:hypothetical protein